MKAKRITVEIGVAPGVEAYLRDDRVVAAQVTGLVESLLSPAERLLKVNVEDAE